ncbi:MAG: SPOR domain-containing protein [Bacteroidaceae bacterium]|nr:SPOR domain-containing protein [Bacteroidaceae bacterium]
MKRTGFYSLVLMGAALTLVGCKSSQNTYKQAYEKAVEADVASNTVAVTPVQTVPTDDSNVTVREEKVTVVSGNAALKDYSVVCGSFSLKTNADALRQRLAGDGFPAIVVVNEAGKTYRVICNSFDTKAEAAAARASFKAKYPDNQDFQQAWILYKK